MGSSKPNICPYFALFEAGRLKPNHGKLKVLRNKSEGFCKAETLNEAIYNAREVLEVPTIMFENKGKELQV